MLIVVQDIVPDTSDDVIYEQCGGNPVQTDTISINSYSIIIDPVSDLQQEAVSPEIVPCVAYDSAHPFMEPCIAYASKSEV